MFGAHIGELAIGLVLMLVVFGPKRLPEVGASLGKGIRDFKKHVSDLEDHVSIPDVRPVTPEPITVEQSGQSTV